MKYLIYKNHKAFSLLLIISLTIGCASKNAVSIDQLKGYWEIDFVKQQGEVFKTNSVTPLYDHYILNEKKGVLNKVAPSMMGIFQTSTNASSFQVEKRKEDFYLKFKTSWDEWSKKIVFLDDQKLILEHEKKTFHYKRPRLINLNNELFKK
jgi:hypothetical protein